MRKWFCWMLLMAAPGIAVAQSPKKPSPDLRRDAQAAAVPRPAARGASTGQDLIVSSGTVQATPEMWYYSQERNRLENPQLIRQRAAQQASEERRARLESQRWYGVSIARPTANPTPFLGTYGQQWVSNSNNPQAWRTGHSVIIRSLP